MVSASGNNATTNPAFPAAAPCAIAVGSHGPGGVISGYSNGGSWVDLVAPGEGMESSFPLSNGATMNGTSMAAPMVAGAAALLRAKQPSLTVRAVATHLAQGAAASTPTVTGQPLAGALDPVNALASLAARTPVGSTAKLVEDHC